MRSTQGVSTLLCVLSFLLVGTNCFRSNSKLPRSLRPSYLEATTVDQTTLSETELIQRAKDFVYAPSFDYIRDALAEDFVFRGPVIGPLVKDDYMRTLSELVGNGKNFYGDVIQDFQLNAFGFTVDPVEPTRVWYFVRERGVFLGDLESPALGNIPANGKTYVAPPEARSITFDHDGKVKYYSIGYVTDRFSGDNTNGKAGLFGALHVMGVDIPSEPGSPILRFIQWLGTEVLSQTPSYSKEEKLPSWWKDKRKGSEL